MAESTDMAASHRDVLATIGRLHDETPPKGNEIADNCAIGGDHIYHILGVLAEKGFIERRSDPVDERVTRNALTKKGYGTLEELKAQYTAVDQPATLTADSHPETEDDACQNLRTDGGLRPFVSPTTRKGPTIISARELPVDPLESKPTAPNSTTSRIRSLVSLQEADNEF